MTTDASVDAVGVAETTEAYYDSTEADSFYAAIWGGEDIHIGIYESPDEAVATASARTVERMADALPALGADARVLDLGAGYGGAGRALASRFGCRVDCLNLSEVQNERNRVLTRAAGLEDRVRVVHASFESIPGPEHAYDVVWSQDAMLHSGARARVLSEVARVLVPGGISCSRTRCRPTTARPTSCSRCSTGSISTRSRRRASTASTSMRSASRSSATRT